MKKLINTIRAYLASLKPIDAEVLAACQHKIPRSVTVEVREEGKWLTAVVKTINGEKIGSGFATQGRDEEDLIVMINDAVQTYLDIPPEVCARMPILMPENKIRTNSSSMELVRA